MPCPTRTPPSKPSRRWTSYWRARGWPVASARSVSNWSPSPPAISSWWVSHDPLGDHRHRACRDNRRGNVPALGPHRDRHSAHFGALSPLLTSSDGRPLPDGTDEHAVLEG